MPASMLQEADIPVWVSMRADLWPDEDAHELAVEGPAALAATPPLVVFVYEAKGELLGFLELSLRQYAEGCASSPVPYVEGWYVRPDSRRQGVGRALIDAAVQWSRDRGYSEMGSDALASNHISQTAHRALGFQEVEPIVVFRRDLRTK